jgi:myosin-5
VRELRGLKAEAKSADKFKEISYQLENKVVELTQTLQKRTAENRELNKKYTALEQQVLTWQGKHAELDTRARSLEADLAKPTVPLGKFEEAVNARQEVERKMADAVKRVADQEKEIERLTAELTERASEMEQHHFTIDTAATKGVEDAGTIAALRGELTSLKEQISRNNALAALTKGSREPTSPTMPNGLRTLENINLDRAPSSSRRKVRRHSATGGPINHLRGLSADESMVVKSNPRAVSVMFPSNGITRPRDSNGLPTVGDNASDEIIRLLEDEEGLEEDVIKGLITELRIPQASLHTPHLAKEIIFPAHLISLVSNEMWKQCMVAESETFLANVMQAIQTHVMVSALCQSWADIAELQRRRCHCARNLLAVQRPRDPLVYLRRGIGCQTGYRSWIR